ncbi:M23 family metallopeptidase [Streptomyces sp. NPDC006875]|uniref:M23 family metallopeptidase n=1 Tax=Streptomyces sp. NPDC006875 TaxID=3154781 RepID=UPI0033F67EB3
MGLLHSPDRGQHRPAPDDREPPKAPGSHEGPANDPPPDGTRKPGPPADAEPTDRAPSDGTPTNRAPTDSALSDDRTEPTRRRRRPGPFTLLALPGLTVVLGFAGFMAATGRLSSAWPEESDPHTTAAGAPSTDRVDASYVPWLREAARTCTLLKPSVLAAQIDRTSGWNTDPATLSGSVGIAGFTESQWRTWGKDADGNGRSSPRDPVDAIMALARQDCALAEDVTRLRTRGTVSGELLDLTLAAYTVGADSVTRAGRVPAAARTYLADVGKLSARYRAFDREKKADPGGGASGILAPPVTTLVVSSPFGTREHPLTGVTKLHTGVDFAASRAAPVSAARQGRVVFAGMTKAYGNRVVIDHGTLGGRRLETTYSHMSSLLVTAGQSVQTGAAVGFVGSTGLSTGPHLHFEVLVDGTYTDPMPWLAAH